MISGGSTQPCCSARDSCGVRGGISIGVGRHGWRVTSGLCVYGPRAERGAAVKGGRKGCAKGGPGIRADRTTAGGPGGGAKTEPAGPTGAAIVFHSWLLGDMGGGGEAAATSRARCSFWMRWRQNSGGRTNREGVVSRVAGTGGA